MSHNLSIDLLRQLPHNNQRHLDDLLSLQIRQRPQHLPGTRRAHQLVLQQDELRHDAEDVEVGAEREEEVPQFQYLGERGRAGAQGEDGGEGIDLGWEVV